MKNIYINEDSLIFQNVFFDFGTGQLLSPIETQNYVIVQVTDSNYKNGFIIESHRQCCDIEITFPLTDGLYCSANGVADKLHKYEIYLSLRDELHELKSTSSCRFQTLAVNFKNGPCFSILNEIKSKAGEGNRLGVLDISSKLTDIIAEFMLADSSFSVINLDALITSVLVSITRQDSEKPDANILSTEEKLPIIINYIDSHFLEISSLEEVSDHFGYTHSHICKVFKKAYGLTPGDYLLSKKMGYSVSLLKQGKNLNAIAELLGYSTPYNFSRAFKNMYGVSPSKYLKQ